ncbi:hypothetical protein [Geodermatophilus sp. URMC 64]
MGAPDTGGGGTASNADIVLVTAGGTALLVGAFLAGYAVRRREVVGGRARNGRTRTGPRSP